MTTAPQRQVQRRRSQAQWQRVMSAQAASGLSQQAYCRRHGIAYSSFCRWKRKLSEATGSASVPAPAAFVELEPVAPAASPRWDVELELGEGVYLRLRRG